MKRYRYILGGTTKDEDPIHHYRLVAGNNMTKPYDGRVIIRVHIPDDLKLTKLKSDSFSTTTDKRTINELGYDILIWNGIKNKWTINNQYKGMLPCEIDFENQKFNTTSVIGE